MSDNLEPINIDINMRQNVSDESDKATQSMDNLASSSSATIAAMEKDIARQVEVIKKMTLVIEDLQNQISANPDLFTDDQVRKISEANQSLSQTQKELENYASTTASMSEAIGEGADVTDLMKERTQDLSGTEERLKETMTDILDTQSEVNESMSENSEVTDSNTKSTTANTIANKLMSATVREICSALGIENTAVVQAISNTRTITGVKSLWTSATRLLNTQLGISIALSKALVASGIGLLIVGIAAVVYAYNNWDEAARNQKAAEEQLNKILEESADRKNDLESKTKSLISTVNSETKTIEDRIVAYKELQNIYPKVLESLDLQTFKMMGATEQQKLLNQAIYEMDVTHIEGELTKYKKQLTDLSEGGYISKIISEFKARSLLDQSFTDYFTTTVEDVKEQVSNTVDLLEKQRKKQEEIAKEAEFLKKPESERRQILAAQLEELLKQKEALDQNSEAAQSFANQTDSTTNSVVQLGNKAASVSDNVHQWSKQPDALKNIFAGANFEASILQANIAKIQGQINQIDGVGSAAVVKNKEYFEKQKKDFKDFKDSLPSDLLSKLEAGKSILPSQMITSPEEYNRLKSIQEQYVKLGKAAKEAAVELKIYEPEKKVSKKTTDKTQQKQAKAAEDLAKKAVDYQNRINAARIAAMEEGSEKERKTLEENYRKEKAIIAQEFKELEKLEKEAKRPATAERDRLTKLDSEVDAAYLRQTEDQKKASKKIIGDVLSEVNSRFASELDNNLNEINKYYDEKVNIVKDKEGSIAAIEDINAKRAKAISSAKLDAAQKEIDFETEIALRREALSNKTYLFEADRQKAILKIHQEDKKQKLDNLKEEYAKTPTKELEKEIQSATLALDEFGKELENLKVDKIRQVASFAADITGTLGGLFQQGGAFSNETIDQLTGSVTNITQGFASGGVVGGIFASASEAINFLNSAFSAEKRHREALNVLLQAKIAMQREYNLLLLEEQLQYKNGTSIFGTDTIGKVVNSIEVYRQSIQAYKKELQGSFSPDEAYEKSLEKQAEKGGIMSYYFDNKLKEYRKQADLYNKGMGALYDAQVVTGHKKTGLFGWGKGKDTYSKLLDVYPDVIDAEGKLNKERVQSILDTQKMTDETRNLLKSLLDLEKQAESAQDEMRSLLQDTFGSLGDSLATSIVDAFASGEDALMNFKGNVTDVLNGFAKQMVYSQFLSKLFSGLQGDIEDAYNQLADGAISEQDLSKEVTDLLGDFFGGLDGTVGQANQFLEEFWKNAEAAGFDRPDAERTGASKGIATASQDSMNELNGGIYALRQSVNDIRNLDKEALAIQKTQQASLDQIAENTRNGTAYLQEIKRDINSLATSGIKIKDR